VREDIKATAEDLMNLDLNDCPIQESEPKLDRTMSNQEKLAALKAKMGAPRPELGLAKSYSENSKPSPGGGLLD
jgi:hypothetical protein